MPWVLSTKAYMLLYYIIYFISLYIFYFFSCLQRLHLYDHKCSKKKVLDLKLLLISELPLIYVYIVYM